ncbi:hypothetical protein SDC9_143607 [bioreactor metagenome]|uniref:Uncharacterized protein n=1 Tax=bioreactor metagenome TaxID=1076179 RepID=A0A645E3S5_9ZZZZ
MNCNGFYGRLISTGVKNGYCIGRRLFRGNYYLVAVAKFVIPDKIKRAIPTGETNGQGGHFAGFSTNNGVAAEIYGHGINICDIDCC